MPVSHAAQHAAVLRAMDQFEPQLTARIVADKNAFLAAAAKRYAEHGTPNFFDLVHAHQEKLFGTLKAHYARVIPVFGALALSTITRGMKATAEDDLFLDLARDWIHTEGLKRSKLIADTSEADVLGAISDGMDDGLGTAAIATNIADLTDLSLWRSDVIARTETHAAANYASVESVRVAQKQLGVTMLKQWSPTLDDRTRPAHADMDGSDPIPMDEMFVVDGEEMDRPGDPSGSPENVINCLHPDSVIQSGHIKAMTRHWHEGSLVVIKTKSGHELTVTANHPILTAAGWVAAATLKKGDGVVSRKRLQRTVLRDFDVEHVIPTAQQLYDALAEVGEVVRVPVVRVDFHGDRPHQDVDVVRAESDLRFSFVAPLSKPLHHFRLACTDLCQGRLLAHRLLLGSRLKELVGLVTDRLMSLLGQLETILWAGLRHPGVHAFATVARGDPVIGEAVVNMAPLDAKGSRKGFDGFTLLKAADDYIGDAISSRTGRKLSGFGRTSARDAALIKLAVNPHRGHAVFGRQLRNTQPANVFLDQVINISHMAYSGYVYNLETSNGYYICNGIVQHNCRCVLTYQEAPDSSNSSGSSGNSDSEDDE